MRRTTARAILALLSITAVAREARADAPVVAVLYFDNNTGKPELDVLKKGLADMMVTDLATVNGIVVVERDKLEAILAELKLQKSRYFDAKTAVKVGKGLGAKYAVTGAIAAVAPQMRIDIRLVEIATSKVVVAGQVTGRQEEFFSLQKQLVDKFVAGIGIELSYRPNLGLRVPNVDTLLEYSKGVDLADQGKTDEAKAQLEKVVKASPTFGLARSKIAAIRENLVAAKQRRTDVRSSAAEQLSRRADEFLASHDLDALDEPTTEQYLAFRIVKGAFIVRALKAVLSPGSIHLVLPTNEKRALPLMRAYVANAEKLIEEYDRASKRYAYLSPDLPKDAEDLARSFDMDTSFGAAASQADRRLAAFLLLGEADTEAESKGRIRMAPPLAAFDEKLVKVGFSLLDRAKNRGNEIERASAHDLIADVHELHGDAEKAVAVLQEVLDRYPTHPQYARYEGRIQRLLGMKHDADLKDLQRYRDALERCDDMDFRVGVSAEIRRRMRLEGIDAVERVIDTVIAKCKKKPRLDSGWQYIFDGAARTAAEHGVCALYEKMMRRSLDAGSHPSSLGRRHERLGTSCKNVTEGLPLPVCWMLDMSGMKPNQGYDPLRKGLIALGPATAPDDAWFHESRWFRMVHPKDDEKRRAECRAIVSVVVSGTPEASTLDVSIAKGPKIRGTKVKIGKVSALYDDPSPLAPAWTRVAWKLNRAN